MLKITSPCFSFFEKILKNFNYKNNYSFEYRIISINQDNEGNYVAEIQVVNKGHIFKMSPEEILANDEMTDRFSQRDIRTLTYLGYLGINAPKYAILAQRLSATDNKLIFAIKERGQKKALIRTVEQITSDTKSIAEFDQKDAHLIGYTAAVNSFYLEKKQKEAILNALK